TVLNTTSPVATPPGGSAPMASPSKVVPSARTSRASRSSLVTAWSSRRRRRHAFEEIVVGFRQLLPRELGSGHAPWSDGPVGPAARLHAPLRAVLAPPSSPLGLPIDDHGLSGVDGVADPAGKAPPGVGVVAGPAGRVGGVDRPLGLRVDHAEVGG